MTNENLNFQMKYSFQKKGELNTTESWKCYKKKKGGGREQVPVTKVGSQTEFMAQQSQCLFKALVLVS